MNLLDINFIRSYNLDALDNKEILCLTLCTKKYLPLGKNWLSSLKRHHKKNILIATTDYKTFLYFKSIGITTVQLNLKGRNRLLKSKTQLACYFLQLGFDILFSDVDAIWLKDCTIFIKKEKQYDFLCSQSFNYPLEAVSLWGFTLCSGFYYIKRSEKTLLFLKNWYSLQLTTEGCDQLALNKLLIMDNVKWSFLNKLDFNRIARGPAVKKRKQFLSKSSLKSLVKFFISKRDSKTFNYDRWYSDQMISGFLEKNNCKIKIGILPFKKFRRGYTDQVDDPYMAHIGFGGDIKHKIACIKESKPNAWFLNTK